ncbi:hypothetical protein ACUUL3_06415 [Thiovibrio sp. JS02]
MESIYYIGLDVHKKTIAYCIKTANGVNTEVKVYQFRQSKSVPPVRERGLRRRQRSLSPKAFIEAVSPSRCKWFGYMG